MKVSKAKRKTHPHCKRASASSGLRRLSHVGASCFDPKPCGGTKGAKATRRTSPLGCNGLTRRQHAGRPQSGSNSYINLLAVVISRPDSDTPLPDPLPDKPRPANDGNSCHGEDAITISAPWLRLPLRLLLAAAAKQERLQPFWGLCCKFQPLCRSVPTPCRGSSPGTSGRGAAATHSSFQTHKKKKDC